MALEDYIKKIPDTSREVGKKEFIDLMKTNSRFVTPRPPRTATTAKTGGGSVRKTYTLTTKEEILDRLKVILESRKAGNTADDLEELTCILDILVNRGLMKRKRRKELVENYLTPII